MYYNRRISDSFAKSLEVGGDLRWLYDYVRQNPELDLLIGKNNSKQWISVYRGLSRVLTISSTANSNKIKLDGANAFKELNKKLYGQKEFSDNFYKDLDWLVKSVSAKEKFDRYYNNRKEGYFQNELSRKYGICGDPEDNFAIIDKEAVIGHENIQEKNDIYGRIRSEYKDYQKGLSQFNAKRFGKNLDKKPIGNEVDFLALDRDGNLLLIEYKHGTNTSGIYLSPLQIGMYYDLFSMFPRKELEKSAHQMIEQKKRIGLINPKWKTPAIKDVVPVLIISEYNYNSSAKIKFQEVLAFMKKKRGAAFLKKLRTYNYTTKDGIVDW